MKFYLTYRFVVMTSVCLACWMVSVAPSSLPAQDQAGIMRGRLKDTAADFWIYDDIDAGYAKAADTGNPLLISFRCVP